MKVFDKKKSADLAHPDGRKWAKMEERSAVRVTFELRKI